MLSMGTWFGKEMEKRKRTRSKTNKRVDTSLLDSLIKIPKPIASQILARIGNVPSSAQAHINIHIIK